MIGKAASKAPSFKAAETKHFLGFIQEELAELAESLPAAECTSLREALRGMVQLVDVMDESPFIPPPAAIQSMHDAYNRFKAHADAAGVRELPKLHQLLHLVDNTARQGNPREYACFEDEGVNLILREIVRSAHRSVWRYRCFEKFERKEPEDVPKRKKARFS